MWSFWNQPFSHRSKLLPNLTFKIITDGSNSIRNDAVDMGGGEIMGGHFFFSRQKIENDFSSLI